MFKYWSDLIKEVKVIKEENFSVCGEYTEQEDVKQLEVTKENFTFSGAYAKKEDIEQVKVIKAENSSFSQDYAEEEDITGDIVVDQDILSENVRNAKRREVSASTAQIVEKEVTKEGTVQKTPSHW